MNYLRHSVDAQVSDSSEMYQVQGCSYVEGNGDAIVDGNDNDETHDVEKIEEF